MPGWGRPGTCGKKLKELAGVGALVREETKDPVTGHSKVLIAPAAFAQPAAWLPPAPRNHGGEREVAGRPMPACCSCGPDAPVVEERTVITRTLCGSCDAELAAHTFTQKHTTIWPPNPELVGWSDVGTEEDPNPQGARLPLPATPVPRLAGWVVSSPAAEQPDGLGPSDQQPETMPGTVSPLLDDVTSLPGVRPGVIGPDDPYFAYLRAIAQHDKPSGPLADGPP